MISQTNKLPADITKMLAGNVNSIADKLKKRSQGDVNADREILKQIAEADENMKKLIYSFLFMLENDGKLNSANIPALKEIEKMDDGLRKQAKKGIKEEDYLRRLAAHFEALTELKLKNAEKMAKHAEMARKYGELAKEHEDIAQAYQK